jgi:hypothetical protein
MQPEQNRPKRFHKSLIVPAVVALAFWGVALYACLATGYVQLLFLFGFIGTSVGLGLGLYAVLPKKHKPKGRWLALILAVEAQTSGRAHLAALPG